MGDVNAKHNLACSCDAKRLPSQPASQPVAMVQTVAYRLGTSQIAAICTLHPWACMYSDPALSPRRSAWDFGEVREGECGWTMSVCWHGKIDAFVVGVLRVVRWMTVCCKPFIWICWLE